MPDNTPKWTPGPWEVQPLLNPEAWAVIESKGASGRADAVLQAATSPGAQVLVFQTTEIQIATITKPKKEDKPK